MADINAARAHLGDWHLDPAVHIPLATVFPLVVFATVRRLRRRFTRDEKLATAVTALFLALLIGVSVVMVGNFWEGMVNMVRLGTTHMSYRAARIGWREHTPLVFITSALLFLLFVLLSYRIELPGEHSSQLRRSG
jgi:predicted PurR-regulated permease PerM